MTKSTSLLRALTAILVTCLICAGCGVQTTANASVLDELPEVLKAAATPTPDSNQDATAYRIYMIDAENKLTTVGRDIAHNASAVMQALLAGTTPEEVSRDITTAITRATGFNSVEINPDGVALVELTEGSLLGQRKQEQRLAVAQIIFSLTRLPGVKAVAFRYPSGWISVQTDKGASHRGQALNRNHFSTLDPLSIAFDEPPESPPVTIVDEVTSSSIHSELSIWLMSQYQGLTPVIRVIPRQPESLMSSLFAGPTEQEADEGQKSALPDTAFVLSLDVDESTDSSTPRTAFLDLGRGSLPTDKELRYQALAQIVFTLTEALEIEGVIVSVGGALVPVEGDAGTLASGTRLTRSDFQFLAPVQD